MEVPGANLGSWCGGGCHHNRREVRGSLIRAAARAWPDHPTVAQAQRQLQCGIRSSTLRNFCQPRQFQAIRLRNLLRHFGSVNRRFLDRSINSRPRQSRVRTVRRSAWDTPFHVPVPGDDHLNLIMCPKDRQHHGFLVQDSTGRLLIKGFPPNVAWKFSTHEK